MKRLHVFMIKSYLGPFIMTFFITIFLLLMQFLWKYIDELVGKGLEIHVIAELMAYASASFIPMALPLAILLSSIMTFGNLGEHYELVALKSSGVSLRRIMMPLVLFTIGLSITAFVFSNYYLPYANLKFYSLLFDVREQRPEIIVKEGIFNDGIDKISIRVNSKNKDTKMMYDLLIFDHRKDNGNTSIIIADSGKLDITKNKQYVIFELFSGKKYEEIKETDKQGNQRGFHPHQIDEFKSQKVTIELEGFAFARTDESLFKEHYHMLNVTQLQQSVDSLMIAFNERKDDFSNSVFHPQEEKLIDSTINFSDTTLNTRYSNPDSIWHFSDYTTKKNILENALNLAKSQKSYVSATVTELKARDNWISKHEIQWHLKFSLAVACFILFFIGAPLGAIIRKGGLGMPVVVAILFFVFYYIISITGEKFAKEGVVSAAIGVWSSSAILLPIGIFLTYKASRESTLFNVENYFKSLNKLITFVTRKKKSE